LEIAKRGPEDEDDLRRIAEEKLDAAEAALEQQKIDLKLAIEEERVMADLARQNRTTEAMASVGSKIDDLIDGFYDSIDGGDGGDVVLSSTDTSSVDVVSSSENVGDNVVPPTSILSLPYTLSTPLLYPDPLSTSIPTHLIISTSPKTFTPSGLKPLLQSLPDLLNLRTLIILSPLGSDREFKGLAGMFSNTDNRDAENELLSELKKLTKFNVIPMTYHVIKIQIEGSKSPSSDIVNGVVLPGITSTSYNNKHAIGLGDIYDGPCSSSFREKVINKIVEGVTWGNRTISLVGEGDVGGEEVDYLLRKGEGPEVLRIGFEGVKNSEGLRIYILEVLRRFKSGVSKFTVDEEGSSIVVKFKDAGGMGYGDKDNKDSEKKSAPTAFPNLKEGGLKINFDVIEETNLILRVERWDYPREWEKRKVAVKAMTEEGIVREVKKRVVEWVEEHRG